MMPIAAPDLRGNEAKYLNECITSSFVSSVGPFVDQLEAEVSLATGSSASVAVQSGTAGLHLALTACGDQPGDLVVIPTFTFIATANAIKHCGAVPWLFDIDPSSWTLNPDLVERKLRQQCTPGPQGPVFGMTGQRVGALMPVYPLGLPADMEPLAKISEEFGIPLIADAAAAIGATYRNRPIGSLALLSVASFNGNKTITCGGGGALFGMDEDLLHYARHLSTTARVGQAYNHDDVGYNYRMTNLQAAVGCAQFERLPVLLQRKLEIRQTYDLYAHAADNNVRAFPSPSWAQSANWLSGFVLGSPQETREMIGQLHKRGIGARSFWKPIHQQEPYRNSPQTSCPVSDEIWNRILTLPSSTSLTDEDLNNVLKTFELARRDVT